VGDNEGLEEAFEFVSSYFILESISSLLLSALCPCLLHHVVVVVVVEFCSIFSPFPTCAITLRSKSCRISRIDGAGAGGEGGKPEGWGGGEGAPPKWDDKRVGGAGENDGSEGRRFIFSEIK